MHRLESARGDPRRLRQVHPPTDKRAMIGGLRTSSPLVVMSRLVTRRIKHNDARVAMDIARILWVGGLGSTKESGVAECKGGKAKYIFSDFSAILLVRRHGILCV